MCYKQEVCTTAQLKLHLSSRVQEPLSAYNGGEEETNMMPSPVEFLPVTEDDQPDNQNPFKPCWGMDVARQECARHSERYLHRILH